VTLYGMITNDVSDCINLLIRIAQIICNHPLYLLIIYRVTLAHIAKRRPTLFSSR
jgi:hypothetical protein